MAGPARRLVFFGAPGVGKGTFAARIAPKVGVPTISTGEIMRAEIKQGTELGKKVKSLAESGQLVPDELVDEMVKHRLREDDAQNGYILDGYPRTVNQAKALDAYESVDLVLNFTLPDEVLMSKLLGRRVCEDCGRGYNVAAIHDGELDMPPLLPKPDDCDTCKGEPKLVSRADDTESVVRDRLRIYKEETEPILGYYEGSGKLRNFPVKKGIVDTDKVYDLICGRS